MSTDSGHDCDKLGRIVNDNKRISYSVKLKKWNDSQLTLFKKPIEEKPLDPFVIIFEQKCPLIKKE